MVSICNKLKVLAFVDGRPGHEKQTNGILDSLKTFVDVEVKYSVVPFNPFWKDLFSLLQLFVGRPVVDKSLISFDPDILIGTGRRTHIPMLGMKKRVNAALYVCMSPFFLFRPFFDLCFVPKHDGLKKKANIFFTVGPPNQSKATFNHDANRQLILIGGIDSKSHHWDELEICNYVESLINSFPCIQWTISSSPRTPVSCEEAIARMVNKYKAVEFLRFKNTEKGWVEHQYDINKMVWVTSDSMSMVYEALSGGCQVGLIPVQWNKRSGKFARSEQLLLEDKWVVSLRDSNFADQNTTSLEPLNESQRCAQEIIKRWKKES